MPSPQELLTAYDSFLIAKEKELLEKQNEVFKFIETPHKAKGTKAYIKAMRATEIEINKTISELLTLQQNPDFSKGARQLYTQTKELKGYIKDINKTLTDDLAQKQLSLMDPIKTVGFIAGMAVAFVNIAKNTFDPNLAHKTAETSAGALTGVAFGYHKQIGTSFRYVASALMKAPRNLKNSFFLFYAKEQSKETGKKMLKQLKNEKSFMITIGPTRADTKRKKAPKKLDAA